MKRNIGLIVFIVLLLIGSGLLVLQLRGEIPFGRQMVTRVMGTETGAKISPDVHEGLFDLMKESGANTYLFACYYENYDADISAWKQEREWCRERNLMFDLACFGPKWLGHEGLYQWKHEAILNIGGKGDAWVDSYKPIIKELQPDIITIMEEPEAKQEWDGGVSWAQWRSFAMRCINEWSVVAPSDVRWVVDSVPFWDLNPILTNPIPDVTYNFHCYYRYDGSYSPNLDKWALAYWHGDVAEGKRLFYEELAKLGVQKLIDAGYKLNFGECGSHAYNPNALVFMQDLFDYCKDRNIGVIQFSMMPDSSDDTILEWAAILDGTGWSYGQPYPTKLNALGEVWAKNMREK